MGPCVGLMQFGNPVPCRAAHAHQRARRGPTARTCAAAWRERLWRGAPAGQHADALPQWAALGRELAAGLPALASGVRGPGRRVLAQAQVLAQGVPLQEQMGACMVVVLVAREALQALERDGLQLHMQLRKGCADEGLEAEATSAASKEAAAGAALHSAQVRPVEAEREATALQRSVARRWGRPPSRFLYKYCSPKGRCHECMPWHQILAACLLGLPARCLPSARCPLPLPTLLCHV
jgi:hypothetical protein